MMTRGLRILLVNAVNPDVEVEHRYPNLGLGYLVASVRAQFSDLDVTFKIADRNIQREVICFGPHLVGISAVSQNYTRALLLADWLAARKIPVIFGGIHITNCPETLPRTAVAACLGEAEHTFPELVKLFLSDTLTPGLMHNIPGVCFWDGETLVKTRPRPLIPDMDSIPFPARDLLPIRSHTYMFTSRGCPYRCTFCSSSRFWDKLRCFSAEYVVNEIESLVRNHHVTMISIFDDLFVADIVRLKAIIQLLYVRNLLGKVKFTCSCRANLVDHALAVLLAKMGVVSVGLGLESGDEEVLQYLKGGNISVADNFKAINLLKDAGIAVNASFIIGSPLETAAQIVNTYNFIKTSRLDLFDIYLLTPYPGTPVWDYARTRKLVSSDMTDWSVLDVNAYRAFHKAIILSETLSRRDIRQFYDKFRSLRLWRNLTKIISHPMRRDIPIMAWNMLKERFYRFIN
jgi:radical SAM superfamily enzyme YgiQ (UPF0313 family)